MPIYDYQCLYCGNCELRVAGLNDHMAICTQCGNLMLRSEEDFCWPGFDKPSGQAEAGKEFDSYCND
jgi:hypothetical protein